VRTTKWAVVSTASAMVFLAGAAQADPDSDYKISATRVAELNATAAGCKTLGWQLNEDGMNHLLERTPVDGVRSGAGIHFTRDFLLSEIDRQASLAMASFAALASRSDTNPVRDLAIIDGLEQLWRERCQGAAASYPTVVSEGPETMSIWTRFWANLRTFVKDD